MVIFIGEPCHMIVFQKAIDGAYLFFFTFLHFLPSFFGFLAIFDAFIWQDIMRVPVYLIAELS